MSKSTKGSGRRYKPRILKQEMDAVVLKLEIPMPTEKWWRQRYNKPMAQVQRLRRKNCRRTQNAPWSSLGGSIAWMVVRIVYKDSVGSPNNADALTGDAL